MFFFLHKKGWLTNIGNRDNQIGKCYYVKQKILVINFKTTSWDWPTYDL